MCEITNKTTRFETQLGKKACFEHQLLRLDF